MLNEKQFTKQPDKLQRCTNEKTQQHNTSMSNCWQLCAACHNTDGQTI